MIHIADGTLKFDTKIDKEGFNSGIKTMKGSLNSFLGSLKGLGTKFSGAFNDASGADKASVKINQVTRSIEELQLKMKELAVQQIPTDEYVQMEKEIQKTNDKLLSLLNRQEKMQNLGVDVDSKSWKSLQYDIDSTSNKLDRLEMAFERLRKSGNGYTLGKDTDEYGKMQSKLGQLNEKLANYRSGLDKADVGHKKVSKSADKASKNMNRLGKSTSNGRMSMLSMLKMSLLFSVTFQALSGAINAVVTGFQNLIQYDSAANNSVSALMTALLQLKNSLATAFSPILTAITPALVTLINYLSAAITKIGEFFAALLLGQTTFTKAKTAQVDYAKSLENTTKKYKKAKDENKQLSDIDKIHNLTDTKKDSGDTGDTGTPGMPNPKQMFEKVKISDDIIKAVDAFKKTLATLFDPIKESWDKYGPGVKKSFSDMLDSLGRTISAIGKSFADVWTNGTGEQTVSTILKICIDLNKIVKNISDNFRKAWTSDNTGTKIIQNMADVLNILLGDIEKAAKATADWAKGLNFEPILTAFDGLTSALKPLSKTMGDNLLWFYNNVLLPLAGWTITNLLPIFLDLVAAALGVLNSVLVALQPLGQWLWDNFLQPIAAWTGGIIVDVLNAVTDGLNKLSSWINENQETVQNATVLIGSFFAAFGVVSLAATLAPVIAAIVSFATSGAVLSTVLAGVGSAIAAITSPIVLIIAALGLLIYSFIDLYKNSESFRQSIADLGQTWLTALQPLADFIGTVLTDAWNKLLKPAVDFFVKTLLPQLIKTFENLWQNVLVPLANFIGVKMQPVFKILSDLLTMLWKNVILPLAQAVGSLFKEAWDAIYQILNKTVIPILKTVISTLTTLYKNVINPIIDVLWKNFKPAFETVFGGIKAVIEGLKTTLSGIITFVKGVFTGDWETAWKGVKKIFKGIWDALVGIVKTPINLIIDLINGMIGGIVTGINTVIKAVDSLHFELPKALGGFKVGFNIPTVTAPKIPRLATGTVVPANYGEFLSILGDNTRETEVVSPLSTIKQALKEAMAESGSGGRGDIHIYLEGDAKGVFKLVRVEEKDNYNQTGNAVFVH